MGFTTTLGSFGSNAALVFRRPQYVLDLRGNASVRFMCASATISDPADYLAALLGRQFSLVGEDLDTSLGHDATIELVRPREGEESLGAAPALLTRLSERDHGRFLAFVDSTKQA